MRVKIPQTPDPQSIREEILQLRVRIGELRVLLRLAEVQHIAPTPSDRQNPKTSDHMNDGEHK